MITDQHIGQRITFRTRDFRQTPVDGILDEYLPQDRKTDARILVRLTSPIVRHFLQWNPGERLHFHIRNIDELTLN